MAMFVFGFALVQALVVLGAMTTPVWFGAPADAGVPLTPLFFVPVLGGWFGAELVHFARRRRLFDERVRRPRTCLALGAAAGALSAIPAAFGVALLSEIVHDAIVTGSCGALSAACIAWLTARHRAGACVHCAYDLAGIPSTNPCPECGAVASA